MRLTTASLLALCLACFWFVGAFDGCAPVHERGMTMAEVERTVVLVSIDGFRHDYLDRADVSAPALRQIAASGVRADGMVPVYPSVTLPNHWSLVTGLHPEQHGIVGNEIRGADGFDFQGTRKIGDDDPRWWGGEPIWQTAERQGLRAGTVFWPGSHVIQPGLWRPYDAEVSYEARVDTALAWLDLPSSPHFLTLYFEGVDSAGHEYGPDTPQTARAIEEVDAALARLVSGLRARGRYETTDLVIVSDHGMTGLSRQRLVFLDDALDMDTETEHVLWDTPTLVWPGAGADVDALVARLDALEHVSATRREDTPAHLHFRDNDRIAPIVVRPDLGWSVTTRDRAEADPNVPIAGSHGYDVREPDMHALFVARGPSFRRGAQTGPLATVDVHGILARALGIEAAPTAGDPGAADRVMVEPLAKR